MGGGRVIECETIPGNDESIYDSQQCTSTNTISVIFIAPNAIPIFLISQVYLQGRQVLSCPVCFVASNGSFPLRYLASQADLGNDLRDDCCSLTECFLTTEDAALMSCFQLQCSDTSLGLCCGGICGFQFCLCLFQLCS